MTLCVVFTIEIISLWLYITNATPIIHHLLPNKDFVLIFMWLLLKMTENRTFHIANKTSFIKYFL